MDIFYTEGGYDMDNNLKIIKKDISAINELKSLWQELNKIHIEKSVNFKSKYENFANSIGENTTAYTRTIKLYTTLYNDLTDEQKALLTDKNYTITYGTS